MQQNRKKEGTNKLRKWITYKEVKNSGTSYETVTNLVRNFVFLAIHSYKQGGVCRKSIAFLQLWIYRRCRSTVRIGILDGIKKKTFNVWKALSTPTTTQSTLKNAWKQKRRCSNLSLSLNRRPSAQPLNYHHHDQPVCIQRSTSLFLLNVKAHQYVSRFHLRNLSANYAERNNFGKSTFFKREY